MHNRTEHRSTTNFSMHLPTSVVESLELIGNSPDVEFGEPLGPSALRRPSSHGL